MQFITQPFVVEFYRWLKITKTLLTWFLLKKISVYCILYTESLMFLLSCVGYGFDALFIGVT